MLVSFLDPISGLLAAAIGMLLLVALYLLKLRRRALRVTSTLLWEQAVRDLQVNVPLRWLRVSTVLLLQLLALAALAAALARPVIPGDAPAADRIVLIIDNSASMSARDGARGPSGLSNSGDTANGGTTRLDEAKRRATELVRELGRSATAGGGRPSVSVVTSAADAAVGLSSSTVTGDIIEAINSIEPTDHPGGIAAAAELIAAARSASIAAESNAAAPTEEIVALTDTPAESSRPGSEGGSGRIRVLVVGSARSGRGPANTGIVSLSVRRDVERPEIVRVFARLAATPAAPRGRAVRVMLDDRLIAVRTIELGEPTDTAAGTSEAAEATFNVDFEDRAGGVVVVAIDPADTLQPEQDDVLDADNAAAALIGPVTTPAILLVTPDDAPDADPFLLGFFESLRPRALRVVRRAQYHQELGASDADRREAFGRFNLIVFDRAEPEPDRIPDQPTISIGAGLPVAGLRLKSRDPRSDAPRAVRFDSWRRAHPLLRYVALDPIVISPAPPVVDLADGPPGVVELASGPDGPLIVAAQDPSPGGGPGMLRRVVVSFSLMRSNWGPDTSFAVFMANAVDLLTGRGEAAEGLWTRAGQPVIVRPSAPSATVRMTGPGGETREAPPLATDPSPDAVTRGTRNLGVPGRVGVYSLTGSVTPAACVNLLDETETLLGTRTRSSEATLDPPVVADRPLPAATSLARREGRREVWHWFVLASMLLASIEWFVYAAGARG